jgi:hypothetical protein
MKKITTTIPGGHPFDLQDIEFLQRSYTEIFGAIAMAFGRSVFNNPFILTGCGVTYTSATVTNITAGWIGVAGEFYEVFGKNVTLSPNLAARYWFQINDSPDPLYNPLTYLNSGVQSPNRMRTAELMHGIVPTTGYEVILPIVNLKDIITGTEWIEYVNAATNDNLILTISDYKIPISSTYNYYKVSNNSTSAVIIDRMTALPKGSVINLYFESEITISENGVGLPLLKTEAKFTRIMGQKYTANAVLSFKKGDRAAFVMNSKGFWEMISYYNESLNSVILTSQDFGIWRNIGAAGEPAFAHTSFTHNNSNDLVSFSKSINKTVLIAGSVKITAAPGIGFGGVLFTLPPGFRPASDKALNSMGFLSGSWVQSTIYVDAFSGNVKYNPLQIMAGNNAILDVNLEFKV